MPGAAMNRPLFPQVCRGDIYYVDFGNQPGSVVHGIRPAMVIQNDVGNRHAPTLIVAAITTEIKKLRQPTHVLLGTQFGLEQLSRHCNDALNQICVNNILSDFTFATTLGRKRTICQHHTDFAIGG